MKDNHEPVVGHWVVNGQDFCTTGYEASLPHPDKPNDRIELTCVCTKADYEPMARALKLAHGDGSNKQVFWTAWYPTSCPRGERSIETTTREYVCLALFAKALNRLRGGIGNTFDYEIVLPDNPPPTKLPGLIKLHISRYAMDGVGYHVGYESYEGTMRLVSKRENERNSMQIKVDPFAAWLVDLATLDVRLVDAPDEYEPECDCCEENCTCLDGCDGGYSKPDDDFVWQEVDHIVTQAKETPLVWSFNNGEWSIVDYVTGKVES